jgi:hypothetical protein
VTVQHAHFNEELENMWMPTTEQEILAAIEARDLVEGFQWE